MKRKFIFTIVMVLFSCVTVNAQQNILKYLLIEVYNDSDLIKIDTARHNISLYAINRNRQQESSALPNHVFCFGKNKSIKSVELKIDNIKFIINTRRVNSKFAVLKIFINADAIVNGVDLSVKNGDAIYKLTSCSMCHKIEITQLPVIAGKGGNLTTGYKLLDDYILK